MSIWWCLFSILLFVWSGVQLHFSHTLLPPQLETSWQTRTYLATCVVTHYVAFLFLSLGIPPLHYKSAYSVRISLFQNFVINKVFIQKWLPFSWRQHGLRLQLCFACVHVSAGMSPCVVQCREMSLSGRHDESQEIHKHQRLSCAWKIRWKSRMQDVLKNYHLLSRSIKLPLL
jgi:hypothetical protein